MKAEPLQTARGAVYAPEAAGGYESGGGADPATIALMGVTLAAMAGAAMQVFEAQPAPVIAAPEGPIKVAISEERVGGYDPATSTVYAALSGAALDEQITLRPGEEEPLAPGVLGLELPLGDTPEPAPATAEPLFGVQLGAYSSEGAARARWQALLQQQPSLLADAQVELVLVEAGAKGRLYRLRAGRFEHMEDASRLCERLDAAGVPCMTTQR